MITNSFRFPGVAGSSCDRGVWQFCRSFLPPLAEFDGVEGRDGKTATPLLATHDISGWFTLRVMPFHPFVAFEGPIASGKTTHAVLLARRLGAVPILEEFPDNEFLADFYGDQTRWALPMQLSFLALRTAQVRKVVHPLNESVIVDYSYLKDPAFAQLLLKERELRLYLRISAQFQTTLAKHDLIVYLDARNEVLLERIRRRNLIGIRSTCFQKRRIRQQRLQKVTWNRWVFPKDLGGGTSKASRMVGSANGRAVVYIAPA